MSKLAWCCRQKDGIRLIEPNENLAKSFLAESDNDFAEMKNASTLKWKNIEGYYACYNVFYAILQKIGIKCEIHDCTLELFSIIRGFSEKQIELIKSLKSNRINVQYYLQTPKEINEKEIADFILASKNVLNFLSYDEIQDIRKKLSQLTQNYRT